MRAAGAVTPLPLEMGSVPSSWSLAGGTEAAPVTAHMRTATPGYLDAMGIPLVRGRFLEDTDGPGAPSVAAVNEAFVHRYLEGRDPLGVTVTPGADPDDDAEAIRIVGVVGDVRFRSLTRESEPEIYLPSAQLPTSWGSLVVRADAPRAAVVQMVGEAVHAVDPELPLSDVRSGEEIIGRQLRTSRVSTVLGSVFAGVATALTLVGILGVLALLVARRTREIGLRMVLGAAPGDIRWFILFTGMKPVLVGTAAGVGLTLGASGFLAGTLRGGVDPTDPTVYVTAVVGFVLVAAAASLVPGLRTARSDPMALLRSE